MKNIFLLPTEHSSRVFITKSKGLGFDNQILENNELDCQNQNIYITSDEEIKKGEWCYCFRGDVHRIEKAIHDDLITWKKIILTTDRELIKDGVQAIDDEFLEWFVKNPTCEFVEVIYGLYNSMGRKLNSNDVFQNQSQAVWKHKIIIPKEELERGITITDVSKQEILEEAIKTKLSNFKEDIHNNIMFIQGANFGANWKKQRMYSEDEVRTMSYNAYCFGQLEKPTENKFNSWFKQFKKK